MTKKSKLWPLAFGLSLIVFAGACQKGQDIINPPTSEEILADNPWVYAAHTIEPGIIQDSLVITDLYAQLDSCDQDNIYSFSSTGAFTFEQGDITCTPSSEQIIDNGTWSVNSDETELLLNFSALDDKTYEIFDLDRDQMILLLKYTDNGTNFTETLTN